MIVTRWIAATALTIIATGAAAQSRLVGELPRRDNRPLTVLPGIEAEYGQVRTSEGLRLRSIITRPAAIRKPQPAIMLIQWVSCGSIDFSAQRMGDTRFLVENAGMAVIRVERRGTGDSEGEPCSALDFDTELRHYSEALAQLRRHPWIDPDRVILYGSSLGAMTAPLIAQTTPVAGIAVQGGGALTYLERMIQFERLFLTRSGRYSPSDVHDEMNRRIAFLSHYLSGATPQQIAEARPELKDVWSKIRGGTEAPDHYGRPYRWHWQLARQNMMKAWGSIGAPVLVLYAEYDQFETEPGHKMIVDIVNRNRPGSAQYIRLDGLDHNGSRFASADDAYRGQGGRDDPGSIARRVISWSRNLVASDPDKPAQILSRR